MIGQVAINSETGASTSDQSKQERMKTTGLQGRKKHKSSQERRAAEKKVPARRIFKTCTILTARSTEASQAQIPVAAPGPWRLALHLLQEQPPWLCGCQWLRPHVGPSHPRCEVAATTGGWQGCPCPHLGPTPASGAVAMVTTATCVAKPTGRNTGHSCVRVSCWVRRGQGRDRARVRVPRGDRTPHLRVWACAVSSPAPRLSLRVSRGGFRGDRDSKRLLSTCTTSTRKEKAPDAMEKGESKASLPTSWQSSCQGSQRGAGGGGRGRQERSSHLSKWGPGWDPCACNDRFIPMASSPAHQPATHGQSRALGVTPQGRFPGPAEALTPMAFALSPPACMLCHRAAADPDVCGHKLEAAGLCAHEFCLVSSPRAPSSFLPGSP